MPFLLIIYVFHNIIAKTWFSMNRINPYWDVRDPIEKTLLTTLWNVHRCVVHCWTTPNQETYTKSIKFELLAQQTANARVIRLGLIFVCMICHRKQPTTKNSFMSISIFVVCCCCCYVYFSSFYRLNSRNGHWIPHAHTCTSSIEHTMKRAWPNHVNIFSFFVFFLFGGKCRFQITRFMHHPPQRIHGTSNFLRKLASISRPSMVFSICFAMLNAPTTWIIRI